MALQDNLDQAILQEGADITAALTFIVPQDEKPYFESAALTGTVPKVHFQTHDVAVPIKDARRLKGGLSVDREGFELLTAPTSVRDLYDDDQVSNVYEAELEALLKERFGADRVVVFDYTRRSDSDKGAANPDGLRGPASRVHVDYTELSGPQRARDTIGAAEVERVLKSGGRIMQVNVWRPIKGPVQSSPLAVADASTVDAGVNLVATDQRFPDRVGEIYQIAHSETLQWYWVSEMEAEEVLLLKGWDSLDDGRARFTPHGAFIHPDQTAATPARESIEARTYLIFEGE